ncbi:aldehyde dehydrogenase family protein [Marinobacterium sp. YM272]|uniref:aldehyde dehydrogenase family protein n=1 Tax=Marinobacterium sp. YM272 TaxID=3421654 RepID=UPI003D7F4899
MLPLPLYFSDEFRLMSPSQLLQGVFSAALTDDGQLADELQGLGLTFRTESATTRSRETLAPSIFAPPAHSPRVHTTVQANHHFNRYLQEIERLAESPVRDARPHQLQIDPLTLYPNCSLHPDESALSSLTMKLVALVQIAQTEGVCLILQQPTEQQLELWLMILARLLQEPSTEGPLGIGLSATSKRLLPALGYLESLGNECSRRVQVQIFERPFNNDQRTYAKQETPMLSDRRSIRLNLAAACAFLESRNACHLIPELVITDPSLKALLEALYREQRWPVSLCEPPPVPKPRSDLGFNDRPCSLRGIDKIEKRLKRTMEGITHEPPVAAPIIDGEAHPLTEATTRYTPAAIDTPLGQQVEITEAQARQAFEVCSSWHTPGQRLSLYRGRMQLQTFAGIVLGKQFELATLCARETGKPINDCLYEIEDAIVLLDQHLQLAPEVLSAQELHSDSTGSCELTPLPLGTLLGITPWSQPILQFVAMTSAALLTGNSLLIKPASHATLTADWLFRQLLAAGVPREQFALVPGSLGSVGDSLLEDYRLDALLFCGSALAAAEIQHKLTRRTGAPLVPLLTDTGGRHAAILDADQSVDELLPRLLRGAFSHSGQHYGSLRILYLEERVAEAFETALAQAIQHLRLGHPEKRDTDIGPLVSREQMDNAYFHLERFRAKGRLIAQGSIEPDLEEGYFVPPALLRLYTLDELQVQLEAPILHLVRFQRSELASKLDEINRSGSGMALSLFSGDEELIGRVLTGARVGELNINPTTLCPNSMEYPGAGLGLSGTGRRPGTADYLKSLIRYQRLSGPGLQQINLE